ncbi:UTP11-like, U3 small nucleolar ribonucleoprotein [Borealophlyctis nickersoniae]|nr:UTP11-like, U3 small nucleolar ribonucleoprotein [Borealophlyctis nickersoniae]
MSSLRNVVHRREHRERAQPKARERLGLLEKKKDYVLRARDFHKKQNAIKKLKQKAQFKNPDEFYFGMIKSQTKAWFWRIFGGGFGFREGVHVLERNEKFDHDFLKLLKTQDQNYVNYQRAVNQKKIERLKNDLHLLEEDEEEGDDEEMLDFIGSEDEAEAEEDAKREKAKRKLPKHTIFVDGEEDVEKFDPVAHFNTPAELLNRKYNRPTKEMLETVDLPVPNGKTLKKLNKARESSYRELSSRIEREQKLRKAQLEMSLQKNLMGKGSKKKVGVDKNGLPVWKWRAERKK